MTPRGRTFVTVNSADNGGGAERIARQLHENYLANGEDAWLAVGIRRGDDARTVEVPNRARRSPWTRGCLRVADALPAGGAAGRLGRAVRERMASPRRWRARQRGEEDFDFPGTSAIPTIGGRPAAALHLHNLHGGYFDLRQLPAMTGATPTLISLHDAWLTTGHCSHGFDCERWETGCGACPYLWSYPATPRDDTARNWVRKRELLSRSRLSVGVPCEWLADRVRRSILAPAVRELRVIPYGVDLDFYTPSDRRAARIALGLDPDRPMFLCHDNCLRERTFKDGAQFRGALERVGAAAAGAQWIALGAPGDDVRLGNVTLRRFSAGADDATVVRLLQAADAYVHPARADTSPLSVLEALACGTPVVATAVGGIPEQLKSGGLAGAIDTARGAAPTGAVVPGGDAGALAAVLDAFAQREGAWRAALGHEARRDAERRFDRRRHERDYLEWMRSLAAEPANGAAGTEPRT
ncbi:MAG: glycosyltransferase [Gemmatimonadetes bacterium]|nr:glycosyltransferase [Gemmatimonadota bacterium]